MAFEPLVGAVAAIALAAWLCSLRYLFRRLPGSAFWLTLLSLAFQTAGTVFPVAVGVLAYTAWRAYPWAMRGPFPFSHLGSGLFWLGMGVIIAVTTALCWAVALWLAGLAAGGYHEEHSEG